MLKRISKPLIGVFGLSMLLATQSMAQDSQVQKVSAFYIAQGAPTAAEPAQLSPTPAAPNLGNVPAPRVDLDSGFEPTPAPAASAPARTPDGFESANHPIFTTPNQSTVSPPAPAVQPVPNPAANQLLESQSPAPMIIQPQPQPVSPVEQPAYIIQQADPPITLDTGSASVGTGVGCSGGGAAGGCSAGGCSSGGAAPSPGSYYVMMPDESTPAAAAPVEGCSDGGCSAGGCSGGGILGTLKAKHLAGRKIGSCKKGLCGCKACQSAPQPACECSECIAAAPPIQTCGCDACSAKSKCGLFGNFFKKGCGCGGNSECGCVVEAAPIQTCGCGACGGKPKCGLFGDVFKKGGCGSGCVCQAA